MAGRPLGRPPGCACLQALIRSSRIRLANTMRLANTEKLLAAIPDLAVRVLAEPAWTAPTLPTPSIPVTHVPSRAPCHSIPVAAIPVTTIPVTAPSWAVRRNALLPIGAGGNIMVMGKPRIVVVGAGVVGAAIALGLARRGAVVTLIEEGQGAASGVTRHAFGWINAINGKPGHPGYALLRQGVEGHRHWQATMPRLYDGARSGSILWQATAGMPADRAPADGALQDGMAARSVSPADMSTCEPPAGSTVAGCILAGGIPAAGATGPAALASRHRQAQAEGETIPADIVVLAAGMGINRLVRPLEISLEVPASPAILLRYRCPAPLVNHIVCGPRLEIRQSGETLFVAKSWNGSEPPEVLGQHMLGIMHEDLQLPETVALEAQGSASVRSLATACRASASSSRSRACLSQPAIRASSWRR